jgi:hypothetical protein
MIMLEIGLYRAKAVDHQFGVAETGTEQVAVTFEVCVGPASGERITWYGFFTEAAAKRTLESLRTCGWEGDDVTNLVGVDKLEVELDVVHENYNGELRPRVRWVNKPGGVKMKRPMTEEQKRALAVRMKGLALATRTGAPMLATSSVAVARSQRVQPGKGWGGGSPVAWDGQGPDPYSGL